MESRRRRRSTQLPAGSGESGVILLSGRSFNEPRPSLSLAYNSIPGQPELYCSLSEYSDRATIAVPVRPEEINVATLADAIRHAAPGTTLRLPAGIVIETEPIWIDQPLTLTAEDPRDPPRLRLHAALEIHGDGIVLQDLILIGVRDIPRPGEIGDCTLLISHGSPEITDCRIESESSSAVGIHGAASRPVLRRCRVANAKDAGILIADGARPVVDSCEITEHAGLGLLVVGGADPEVRSCRIGGNRGNGIVVRDGGHGRFERCEVFSNQMTNVAVAGGESLFRECTIRDGAQGGVFVLE